MNRQAGKLEGRTALVTGASSGIGAAIAEELAREGASVTLNYFRSEEAAREIARRIEVSGCDYLLVRADVRRATDVKQMVADHIGRFGRLDILVNNAGDMVRRMPTAETPEEVWRDAIDLNLSSAF